MTTEIGRPNSASTLEVGPIAKAFDEAYQEKKKWRTRVNQIVKQVHPGLYWREDGEQPDQDLGQIKQVVGMYGLASTRGKILDSTFPVGQNPIRFDLACPADHEYSDDEIDACKAYLDAQAMKIWDLMLSAKASDRAFPSGRGFMASMASATDFALGHGDVCVWGQKDLLFEVMRPEQWAGVRDGQGNELRLILRRQFDPKTFSPATIAKMELPEGWLNKPTFERMVWIYTDYCWESGGTWKQTDECNARTIFEDTHDEARIFTLPWHFIPGDQNGRSFFETVYAKLYEIGHLNGALTDITNQMADLKIVVDQNSLIRPAKLIGPAGAIITGGNVRDGKEQGVGVISVSKHQDFVAISQRLDVLEKDTAKAIGLDLELMPNKERTTRLHVEEVVSRLNAMTGGQVISFIESVTNKTIRCAVDVARTSKLLDPVPEKLQEIIGKWMCVRITAGPAAMARAKNVQNTVAWAQVAQTIGTATLPDDMDKTGIIMDLAVDMGLNLSKHRFTPEQVEAMKQREVNRQVQAQSAVDASKALSEAAAPGIAGVPQ